MFKKMIVALAGLFIILGLAAAPAASAAGSAAVDQILVYTGTNFSPTPGISLPLAPRNTCQNFTGDPIKSVQNQTGETVDITIVLFAAPGCVQPVNQVDPVGVTPVSVVAPGQSDSGLVPVVNEPNVLGTLGAVSFMLVAAE